MTKAMPTEPCHRWVLFRSVSSRPNPYWDACGRCARRFLAKGPWAHRGGRPTRRGNSRLETSDDVTEARRQVAHWRVGGRDRRGNGDRGNDFSHTRIGLAERPRVIASCLDRATLPAVSPRGNRAPDQPTVSAHRPCCTGSTGLYSLQSSGQLHQELGDSCGHFTFLQGHGRIGAVAFDLIGRRALCVERLPLSVFP
jgi:hypothetical protein